MLPPAAGVPIKPKIFIISISSPLICQQRNIISLKYLSPALRLTENNFAFQNFDKDPAKPEQSFLDRPFTLCSPGVNMNKYFSCLDYYKTKNIFRRYLIRILTQFIQSLKKNIFFRSKSVYIIGFFAIKPHRTIAHPFFWIVDKSTVQLNWLSYLIFYYFLTTK